MEKKVVKKLKHYDKVLELGRKKYSQEYIDYASGYLEAFRDVIIFDRLNLKHCTRYVTHLNWYSPNFINGKRKANADLATWRADAKNKKRMKAVRIQLDLAKFCKVILKDRQQQRECLCEIETIVNAKEKWAFLEKHNFMDEYKKFDFDKILLSKYRFTEIESRLRQELLQCNSEIERLKKELEIKEIKNGTN